VIQITNLYDPEAFITGRIKHLVHETMLFSKESAHGLDAETIGKMDDGEKTGLVVELMGFGVSKQKDGQRSATAKVTLEWRVTVVTPSELYNTISGAIMCEVIGLLIMPDAKCGGRFELIPDVHEFHKPKFDTSLTAIHATFGYDCLIKPIKG